MEIDKEKRKRGHDTHDSEDRIADLWNQMDEIKKILRRHWVMTK